MLRSNAPALSHKRDQRLFATTGLDVAVVEALETDAAAVLDALVDAVAVSASCDAALLAAFFVLVDFASAFIEFETCTFPLPEDVA